MDLSALWSMAGAVEGYSEDLWQRAIRCLSDDMRSAVEVVPQSKRAFLETVLLEANRQRQVCIRKQWKITKKNGDVIILRDVFEKIMTWVNKFKEVGNAAIQVAPGWASIPWNAVSFLIKVAIDDNEVFAAMIDGLEKVTNIIARNAIFEDVYFRRPTSASSHLRSSLVSLYASVLSFLGTAQRYFKGNTAARLVKSTFDTTVKSLEDALANIDTRQVEVDQTAQIVGMEMIYSTSTGVGEILTTAGSITSGLQSLSSQLVELQPRHHQDKTIDPTTTRQAITSIMGPTQRILEVLERWDDKLETKERSEAFNWLSKTNYRIQHRTERKDRLSDSGEWMFESNEYRNWQTSSISETLWLHGMPGSGKTKLASAVVDYELEKQAANQSASTKPAPCAYFYCSRNKAEPERGDPANILRCIARQLVGDDPSVPLNRHLRQVYHDLGLPKEGQGTPPSDLVLDLILKVLSENPATIVIDALDECDSKTRYELFESLDKIVKLSCNVVKVFLTSRDDGDIVCRLETTPNIYIDAQKNQSDIDRFISTEIQRAITSKRLLRGEVPYVIQRQICSTLSDEANGMFRWVSLQIQNLCDPSRMKVKEDIIHELTRLPKTFTDLYSIAFDKMEGLGNSSFQLGLSSLQLLTAAVAPISWTDIIVLGSLPSSGLGRRVSKQELLDITSEFLEDDKVSDRPKFVHSSAREYLETRWEFRRDQVNLRVSYVCLDYVQSSSLTNIECPYAVAYLGDHVAATSYETRNQARAQFDKFLSRLGTDWAEPGPPLFEKWRELLFKTRFKFHLSDQSIMSFAARHVLLAICLWGLEEYLDHFPELSHCIQEHWLTGQRMLLWEGVAVDGEPTSDWTGLKMAILLDRSSIIRRLSSLGSLPQYMKDRRHDGDTVIHYAIRKGKARMVEVLLECGADPNILNLGGTLDEEEAGATHLRVSKTSMGFRGPNGITSPFAIATTGLAPLHLTVDHKNGFYSLMALLRHGANPNLRNANGNTPLQLALDAGENRKKFFDELIEAGADVNARIDLGQTVLHLAAGMGLTETVATLLAAGADPDVQDVLGHTPYSLAMRSGRTTTAELMRPRVRSDRHLLSLPDNTKISKQVLQQPSVLEGQDDDDDMGTLTQIVVDDYESPTAFQRIDSGGPMEIETLSRRPLTETISQNPTVPKQTVPIPTLGPRVYSSKSTRLKRKSRVRAFFHKRFSRRPPS